MKTFATIRANDEINGEIIHIGYTPFTDEEGTEGFRLTASNGDEIHQTHKAQRRILSRAELVPLHRADFDQIMLSDSGDLITHQAGAAPAQDQHPMDMLMAFQRGVAAGLHLKIAPLNGQAFRTFKQDLARHILVGAAFLVG